MRCSITDDQHSSLGEGPTRSDQPSHAPIPIYLEKEMLVHGGDLRDARRAAGLIQCRLSVISGVSTDTIRRFERANGDTPNSLYSSRSLEKVLVALRTSAEFLASAGPQPKRRGVQRRLVPTKLLYVEGHPRSLGSDNRAVGA